MSKQKRKNFKEALWEIENTPNTLGPQDLPFGTEMQRGIHEDCKLLINFHEIKLIVAIRFFGQTL